MTTVAPVSPRRGRLTPYLLLLPGLLWLGAFFVFPLIQLLVVSLESPYPGYPGYYQLALDWGNYATALTDFAPHFGRSFLYAGLATLAAAVLSYPLAYVIAQRAGRWAGVLLALVVAPFFTSFVLRTIAWRQILADDSPVTSLLSALHLVPGGHLTETPFAVVAGLTYNFLPFMVLPLYASLERIDPQMLEASSDLYASGWDTFRRVTLPLSAPGLLAGVLLTFIPAAGDYVNADLLGSDVTTKMVGNVIDAQFFRVVGGYPLAAALSVVLMIAITALTLLYLRRYGKEQLL